MSLRIISILLLMTAVNNNVFADNLNEGKQLFSTRCTACHSIEKILVGPALLDVDKRRSEEWIISFVHSSQTMIKSGDKDAVALFSKFNNTVMPDHPDLTVEQVKNIITYVKSESSAAAAKPKQTMQRPVERMPDYTPVKFTDYSTWFSILSCIGLLAGVMLIRVKVEDLKG